MTKAHEHDEQSQVADPTVLQRVQPAERLVIQSDPIFEWVRRQLKRAMQNRCRTPDDEDDHHHRGYAHDLQGFLAGFVNSLSVLPPEIRRHHPRKNRSAEVLLNLEMQMGVLQ